MRNNFWQGIVLGGLVATALTAVIGPLHHPQKKPLVERSIDAVKGTASDLAKRAGRTRRRIMRPF